MIRTDERLLGVVHGAKLFPKNVARDAPGNTFAALHKLYDEGRLLNVVTNDRNFSLLTPRAFRS